MVEKITKRNGIVVDFQEEKIARAIEKAFLATHTPYNAEIQGSLLQKVTSALEERFAERIPGVEDVQDIVEKELSAQGYFEVAKAYILYREKQREAREEKQKEVLEKIENRSLTVRKRNGSFEKFDIEQLRAAITRATENYTQQIDIDGIVKDAELTMYDGIPTTDINKSIIFALRSRIESDPIYSSVASRFLCNDLYKERMSIDENDPSFTERYQQSFIEVVAYGIKEGRYTEDFKEFDVPALAKRLVPQRDFDFQYLGMQTLYDRYFMRDTNLKIFELPQHFWMRVAIGLSLTEKDKTRTAGDFYDMLSTFRYTPSTPTLLHAGTKHPQMSSCYITTVEDDLHHIFKCIGDNAQLAKWSGGVGNDWTNIRGTGARIKSTNVGSQGLVPFLKIVDSTTASINRSGKRRGATCVYLETWHYDIEDFLELRKNTGDERRRTHDVNTAHWIPDLFMKRVMEDEIWTLFSPDETPDLHRLYGTAFERRYKEYEKMVEEGKIALFKRMPARDLFKKMVTMLYETGHPWFTFKDPCNIRSPQDHVGVVHSSNLCTEITLNTSKEETAVCNLGSVSIHRHIRNGDIDWELLKETVISAVRMLDNVIDPNFYPTEEAHTANLRHRPIGLGIMGFQDALYELKIAFDSDKAVDLSDQLMEFISYHAFLGSSLLAEEKGTYASFKGSKWDRGIMPLDTLKLLEDERGLETGVSKNSRLDWNNLKQRISQHGMRNSNCLAIAPTATIANITGCLPSIEPIYKNLYVKSNFSGEFTVINKALIEDLKRLGLWSPLMVQKLKFYDGSVQHISEIPQHVKEYYKEVFEIDPIWIIKHAAVRGKWIDQSQSVNIFTASESGKFISDIYMSAWKMGLKTTYYLRTLGASAVEKSTIDINKKFEEAKSTVASAAPRIVITDNTCESCQ